MHRHNYHPGHVTASGFVLRGDAIALVHPALLGIRVQPGGHGEEADAAIEVTARREMEEEVGLTGLSSGGLLDIDVHRFPAKGDQTDQPHFDVRCVFFACSEHLEPGEGMRRARWVRLEETMAMGRSIARPSLKLMSGRW